MTEKERENKLRSLFLGNWPSEERKWLSKNFTTLRHTWRSRISRVWLFMRSTRSSSQRFQLHQANRRADQAQRDQISLYEELEVRNRLFRENQARDCQENEELRRICREETDRARQARIDELSVHQKRNPTTVSQLLAQFRMYRTK